MVPTEMTLLRRPAEIRDVLTDALRLNLHKDVKIVCKEGKLGTLQCHRLVVAAQSEFLQGLMLEADSQASEDYSVIVLPDVKVSDLKPVVKFLYTGKLRLSKSQVPIVKNLLENVLKIDAHVRLPDTDVAAPTVDEEHDNDDRGGDGRGGGGDSGNGSDSDHSPESGPSKKRFKSANLDPHNEGGSSQKLQEHAALVLSTPFPPSPPHSDIEDDEIIVDDDDSIQDVVDVERRDSNPFLLSSKPSTSTKDPTYEHECKFCPRTFPTAEELYPHIIEHVERGHGSSNSFINHSKNPISVAKESGSRVEQLMSDRIEEDDSREDESNTASTSDSPTPGEGRVTRLRSGALLATEQMYAEDLAFEPPLLPPPIPQPPEQGMRIHKGRWVSEAQYNRKQRKTTNAPYRNGRVRKYNYTPGITISGKSKVETFAVAPVGEFACDVSGCGLVFDLEKSLRSHKSRMHHPNPQAKCPECPKMLSTKAAIKKHLLSHRPESHWPYQCPLCFKKFQAKGDLPKHFLTSRHRNDGIPAPGSDEWKALIERGVCVPGQVTWHRRSRGLVAPDQISLQQPPNDDDQDILVQMENIEEDPEDGAGSSTHSLAYEKSLLPYRISEEGANRAVQWSSNM